MSAPPRPSLGVLGASLTAVWLRLVIRWRHLVGPLPAERSAQFAMAACVVVFAAFVVGSYAWQPLFGPDRPPAVEPSGRPEPVPQGLGPALRADLPPTRPAERAPAAPAPGPAPPAEPGISPPVPQPPTALPRPLPPAPTSPPPPTPTPAPPPTPPPPTSPPPTPTPTLTPRVRVSASPESGQVPDCAGAGVLITFTGTVTVDGPATLTYRWERSDGGVDTVPHEPLVYPSGGSKTVSRTWYRTGVAGEVLRGGQTLVVQGAAPASGSAAYQLTCA
ncbi:MAG TPA: hypothetical protein VES42_27560 [Pilimelia sp.]|nr:hypothetical protein [Pilimelia sp.]